MHQLREDANQSPIRGRRPNCFTECFCLLVFLSIAAIGMQAQEKMVLSRDEATVMLEPYAPNIVRVTLSLRKDDAVAAPGYGIVAHAASGDWTRESGDGGVVLKTSTMSVPVCPSARRTATL